MNISFRGLYHINLASEYAANRVIQEIKNFTENKNYGDVYVEGDPVNPSKIILSTPFTESGDKFILLRVAHILRQKTHAILADTLEAIARKLD